MIINKTQLSAMASNTSQDLGLNFNVEIFDENTQIIRAVSTDSRLMTIVPVPVDEHTSTEEVKYFGTLGIQKLETSFNLPENSCQKLLKYIAKKSDGVHVPDVCQLVSVSTGEKPVAVFKIIDEDKDVHSITVAIDYRKHPDWKRIMPKPEDVCYNIALTMENMEHVMKIIKKTGAGAFTMNFNKNQNYPITLRTTRDSNNNETNTILMMPANFRQLPSDDSQINWFNNAPEPKEVVVEKVVEKIVEKEVVVKEELKLSEINEDDMIRHLSDKYGVGSSKIYSILEFGHGLKEAEASTDPIFDKKGKEVKEVSVRQRQIIYCLEKEGLDWQWYSGRFMYGKECPSVTTCDCEESDVMKAVSMLDEVPCASRDNMGMDTVIYFKC